MDDSTTVRHKPTPDNVEVALRVAITKALNHGVKLTKGVDYVRVVGDDIYACAMGCAVVDMADSEVSLYEVVEDRLGIDTRTARAIASGFDDTPQGSCASADLEAWVAMGGRLREEFKPSVCPLAWGAVT
jgi:hypothetical protein